SDVPAIVAALTRLRGFAHLQIDPPVIRRGKSGHFSDKALEGVSHHAIVPNVNVLDDLEQRIARLDDDEKRLLALICRSYLAAVMPDYEYRQTVATMRVPVPGAWQSSSGPSGVSRSSRAGRRPTARPSRNQRRRRRVTPRRSRSCHNWSTVSRQR